MDLTNILEIDYYQPYDKGDFETGLYNIDEETRRNNFSKVRPANSII